MDIAKILKKMDIGGDGWEITQFTSAEDGRAYGAWKVVIRGTAYVLKKAKGCELSVYAAFFQGDVPGAPRFYQSVRVDGEDYFLMEYAQGEDLCRCTREKLTKALDALMALQDRYWEDRAHAEIGFSFEESLPGRVNRGKYLKDPELERAYAAFLEQYSAVPRTLCHDDLLPFNVLVSGENATLIDWEYGGILPYPASLARLIAHGAEEDDAFFYMKEEDKSFAIEYYYENLVKQKGISYREYRNALDLFLLYEYCEWIMLGNRYEDADMERYRQYFAKAKEHIKTIGAGV